MRTGHILSLTLTSLIILTGCQIKQGGDIATQALPASSIQGQHSHTYTYRLDNGLQVILWPNSNSHSRNEASLDLVIHSGSLHEKDNQLGYAHFVEHMLFNQSKDNGDNPVFDALHELNLNLSNHANAYTTFGHTRYYLDLPNASHKRVTKAIELLSLFAYQAAFDCQEVAKEMGVIREEWRLSEPEKQTYQYQRQQLDLANSRYLTRLPIGNLDSIESATPAALQDYYQQHYHPGNATLIITGDIDIDKVATSIADSFDNWPDANKGRAKVYAKPPMRPPSLDIFEDAKEPAYFVWIGNSYANPLATDEATEFANFKLELITDLLHERLKKLATQQSNSLRADMLLRAPIEGTVDGVAIKGAGEFISANSTLITLRPLFNKGDLLIEIQIPSAYAVWVEPGMPFRASAQGNNPDDHGYINGVVDFVSNSTSEAKQGEGRSFRMLGKITEFDLSARGLEPAFLRPGLELNVEVKAGKRRLINYIFDPFTKHFRTAFSEPG